MVLCGANGETLKEMGNALCVKDLMMKTSGGGGSTDHDDDNFSEWKNGIMKPFIQNILGNVDDEIMSIANKIFLSIDSKLESDFNNFVKETFSVSVDLCNFEGDSTGEREKINNWVEQQTNHLIKDLLPASFIKKDTRLVLLNAIYFMGNWKFEFDPKLTEENETFHILDGETCTVTMMNKRSEKILYGEEDGYKWVNLPYTSMDYSITIIIPVSNNSRSVVTKKTESKFDKWVVDRLSKKTEINQKKFSTVERPLTQLSLPKFDIEYSTSLNDVLSGEPFSMKKAFSNTADFSKMTKEPVFISSVIHKAIIKVNEKGTEAAAATAVEMRTKSKKSKPVKTYL